MTQIQQEEIDHLEGIAATYRSRLRVLDRQIAAYGLAVPAHIVLDRSQTEQALAQAMAELRRLRPSMAEERSPYVGLSSFQERDAEVFFGREQLVADLVARVESHAFLAVLGASGSGKSSVVRAGLIPELKGGALPGSEGWRYAILKPGDRPLDALAAALTRLQNGDVASALALSRMLGENDRALLLVADMLLAEQDDTKLVLVIDQAEELWTLAPADRAKRAEFVARQQRPFIELLLTAAESDRAAGRSPLRIILTMRVDFLHRAAEYADLARWIGDFDVIVSPMTPDELRRAIQGPADATECGFETGLVDALVDEVHGQPGALPLLEYALLELWKARTPQRMMTWRAYEDMGKIEGALAARGDAILAARYSMPEERDALRRTLLRLVQPGEGVADTRRRVLLTDLTPVGIPVEQVQALLQPLADERLITASHDPATSADTVEMAHEALIRAWPTFGKWIGEARADLGFQIRLDEAAKEWQANAEDADFLWDGLRLANAEAWIERARPQINEHEQRFLDASRTAERERRDAITAARREREMLLEARASAERRNASRLRVFLAVVSVLLLVAISVTIYAIDRQRAAAEQARLSQAGELAAQAQAVREQFPQRGLLLAVEALRIRGEAYLPAVERSLRDGLANTRGLGLSGHTHVVDAVFSPDGKWLATGSWDKTARLWNLAATDVVSSAVVLRGHQEKVVAVAFSPDSKWLATGSSDNTTRLWNLTASDIAASAVVLRDHTSDVTAVAFSPDGKWLATASNDNTARLWNLTSSDIAANPIVLRDHTDDVVAVAFSPDSKWLATASNDNTARLWNLTSSDITANALVLSGHIKDVVAVAFSPYGKWLATGSTDKTARLWDLTASDIATSSVELRGHIDVIRAVAFSPDGKWLATASNDKTARLWNLTSSDIAASAVMLRGHTREVVVVAFSHDGKRLVTGSWDGTARLWDLTAADVTSSAVVLHGHDDKVVTATFSADGKWLVTGSADGMVRLWDSTTVDMPAGAMVLSGHENRVVTVAFSLDGKWLATGSWDGTARLWGLTAAGVAASSMVLSGHQNGVVAVAFSPDSKWLATGSNDNTARLWNLTTGNLPASAVVLRGHTKEVTAVAFSPDSKWLVTGSNDNTARLWDLMVPDIAASAVVLSGHTKEVMAVAFSPDKKWLVTGSNDNTARLWDLSATDIAASAVVLRGHTDDVVTVAFGPDKKWLVTGSADRTARLWDLTAADLPASVVVLSGHKQKVTMVAFSPDKKWLVTGSSDNTARLWDLTSADIAVSAVLLPGHTDDVVTVAFRPDGKQLATGSNDNTARLWDLTAADVPASSVVLRGHGNQVVAVAFSPDSKWLVTGDLDKTARLWDLPLKTLGDRACRTAGRNLSWEEWQQYFPGEDYHVTCPKLPPHPSFIAQLIAQGADDAKQGKIAEALATYNDAQQRNPLFDIDAGSWNILCRYGSLWNQADAVLNACERAVAQAPDDAVYRDSRGLARALTGDAVGAIEDFNAFITWAQQKGGREKEIAQRKNWIAALQEGREPFDSATLKALRTE